MVQTIQKVLPAINGICFSLSAHLQIYILLCYRQAIEAINSLPKDMGIAEELYNTLALCHNNLGNAYRKIACVQEAEVCDYPTHINFS